MGLRHWLAPRRAPHYWLRWWLRRRHDWRNTRTLWLSCGPKNIQKRYQDASKVVPSAGAEVDISAGDGKGLVPGVPQCRSEVGNHTVVSGYWRKLHLPSIQLSTDSCCKSVMSSSGSTEMRLCFAQPALRSIRPSRVVERRHLGF